MIDEFAKVVAIHPESNCVDVVILRTGARVAAVRVLSEMATGQTGMANLHMPDCTAGYDSENTGKRDIVAALAYYKEIPFVVGFLYPEVSECLFDRKDFKVDRHASDVYTTIDADGNTEFYHPSGTYFRVGTSQLHEDLTGKDYDGVWNIGKNTTKAVFVKLGVKNAGSTVANILIDPAGNVSLTNIGNLTTNTTGNLSATVGGTTTVNSSGNMSLTAPNITLNGNIVLNGPLTQGKGSNGGNCTMLGPVTVTNDVTAGGKSLMNHVHSGVQSGGSNTGAPV